MERTSSLTCCMTMVSTDATQPWVWPVLLLLLPPEFELLLLLLLLQLLKPESAHNFGAAFLAGG